MKLRYELISCAFSGHVLVGTDAASVTDPALARELSDLRWYRCLRCDAWTPSAELIDPTRETEPPRDEIELPLRGRALRDRYVLRLIAVERAIHVLVFGILALLVFLFIGHRHELQVDYNRIIGDFSATNPLHAFHRIFQVSTTELVGLGILLLAYAALEGVEMIGLWLGKRWAEYLTVLATVPFIPFEIYELSKSPSAFKALTLVVNLAVVAYLLWSKRLFGLRGGVMPYEDGWSIIDAATP